MENRKERALLGSRNGNDGRHIHTPRVNLMGLSFEFCDQEMTNTIDKLRQEMKPDISFKIFCNDAHGHAHKRF